MDRYRYSNEDMGGGGDTGEVYEAEGESDHQIGIVPRERQKTASELSEDEERGGNRRKRSYSFGSSAGGGGGGGGGGAAVMMELRTLEDKVQELRSKNSFLQSDLEASQDMYFNMLMEKSKETEKYSQQLKSLQDKITQLKENLDEAQTVASAADTRRKKVEERLLEVKRDNQKLLEEKQEYEKDIKILTGEVEECRKQLVQKEEEIECIRENSSSYLDAWISNEKKELENRIFDLSEALRELKTENKNILKEMSSRNMEPHLQTVAEEISSVNLISTESQTDLLFTDTEDIHEKTPLAPDSGINDFETSLSSDESSRSLAIIDTLMSSSDESGGISPASSSCRSCSCSCLSNSLSSTPDSPLSRDLPLSVLDSNEEDLPRDSTGKEIALVVPVLPQIRINPTWSILGTARGQIGQGAFIVFLFLLAFVLFEIFYGLMWYFRPFKLSLDLSAAAAQHGRLEHLVPPVV